ncbi:MAG: helicase-associated domain-containing protein, partial [Propionibacterium acidifaciens]
HRACALRAAALAELAGAGPGTAVDEEGLAARLAWRRPGLVGAGRREQWPRPAAELVAEARWLGLLALDRTTVLVHALTGQAPPDPGFAEFGASLVLQSDLTAVAPAPLDHGTAQALGELAERESHGATATFRFTGASLRRGLDAGWSPEAITDWLHGHSAAGPDAPLPGPLTTLIADTARAHGAMRVVPVGSVVQVSDPAAAAALLAGPDAGELGLRELAPGVIASTAEPAELVASLRAAGHAPIAERPGGGRYTTPAPRRAPAPAAAPGPEPVDPARLARTLAQRAPGGMGTAEVLAALARAHDADTWVEIGWVDDDGAPQSRLMRVLSLSPGVAHLVRRAAGRISLPLARIVAVGPGGGDGAPVTSSSAGS